MSVSACISCLGPLGHGIHHSVPKTHARDPAPGGGHSGHPRACALPLFDPIQAPGLDRFFYFSWRIRVWTCLATAIESARILGTGQNFAQLSSPEHGTRQDSMWWIQIFIYGLRVHWRWPPPTILCIGPCCHESRNVQDHQGRLKLGLLALPCALNRVHQCVLKLESIFHCSGAPKMALLLKKSQGICRYK